MQSHLHPPTPPPSSCPLPPPPLRLASPQTKNHQVTAVVVSESIVREQSPDKPVSAAVVATGVVRGSTFAVSPSSLSPAVENQIENANNQTTTCPSATPDICSAVGGGSICVSLATDRDRCGSCSNVCPAAQSCVSGVCSCPSATPDLCGSACVNFATDSANCGACGNVCGVSTVCQSGQCRCPVIGVVIDEQQTTSSTIVATVACAGAPVSELGFKCVVQGSPKESPGLGTVSFNGVTATVSGLSPCVPYDCYAVRASPGGDVYSPAAPAVTIDNVAFSVANGFTTTNQPGPSVCGIVYPYPLGSIKGQGPGTKWSVGVRFDFFMRIALFFLTRTPNPPLFVTLLLSHGNEQKHLFCSIYKQTKTRITGRLCQPYVHPSQAL